jgi:hypothetical protein
MCAKLRTAAPQGAWPLGCAPAERRLPVAKHTRLGLNCRRQELDIGIISNSSQQQTLGPAPPPNSNEKNHQESMNHSPLST